MDAYLSAFDDAWSHSFESVTAALKDVTADEAEWQAACYADAEPEVDWPPPGTIAWQVAHLTHCKRYYTDVIRCCGTDETPTIVPRTPVSDFADELAALRSAHAAQRRAIAALSEDALEQIAGNDMPLGEFLRMATRHDTWHAAQIAVARRLWRTRKTD